MKKLTKNGSRSLFTSLYLSVLGTLVFVAFSACQLSPLATQKSAKASLPPEQEISKQAKEDATPRVKSRSLYAALAHAKALEARAGDMTTLTAFEVVCEINGDKGHLMCHANTLPEKTKGSRRVEFSEADSGAIFDHLSRLPIQKGETGLVADYVLCRRTQYTMPGQAPAEDTECSVAMPIQYVPHSTMPSISEGED